MERFVIAGGQPLSGRVSVQGAKNAALPNIAAALLTDKKSTLLGIPRLSDVDVMLRILSFLGVDHCFRENELSIDPHQLASQTLPRHLVSEMRSSIILMGPILARFGRVKASYPGGCAIGARPIDLHIKGFKALGAKVEEKDGGYIYVEADRLRGAEVHMDFPSVGATQNTMMAAVLAEGETVITNAAKEPEIIDLAQYINRLGGCIHGAGTDTIYVRGVTSLRGTTYRIIPDRIVAGTLLLAAVMTRGDITLEGVNKQHLEPVLAKLREIGVAVTADGSTVSVACPDRPKAVSSVLTLPHPGFPTDLQAPMMAALTTCEGLSSITETVFESRFKHAAELNRMGAHIATSERTAYIKGVAKLHGAVVTSTDLRAGAALVLAGLAADGVTVVEQVSHIDRGYESLEITLQKLGGKLERLHW